MDATSASWEQRSIRRWRLAAVTVLVAGLATGMVLAEVVQASETGEFDALAHQAIDDIVSNYDQLAGALSQFGIAVSAGVPLEPFIGDPRLISSPLTAAGTRGIAFHPSGAGRPTILNLSPADATNLLGLDTPAPLEPLDGEASYLVTERLPEGRVVAVIDLRVLIENATRSSKNLLDVSVSDRGAVVKALDGSRTDFSHAHSFELGSRQFGAVVAAGPLHGESRAPVALWSAGLVGLMAAAAILQLGRATRSNLARERDKAAVAEQLGTAKDRFIASVAHELRTPLAVVMGMAMELASDPERFGDDERREMIGLVAGQSMQMKHLVDDMLVAGRVEAGTLSISPDWVGMVRLANDVLAELDPADTAWVHVRPADLSPVFTDPVRWSHAFRNLVRNAVEHASTSVSIAFGQDRDTTWVAIRDDGGGIPEADRDKVFLPYYQVPRHHTMPTSVGVGLTVARSLAHAIGGEIGYRRIDGWTEFRLAIPTAKALSPAPVLHPAEPA